MKDRLDLEPSTDADNKEIYRLTKNGKLLLEISAELVDETKKEIAEWYKHLNDIVGLVCFTFALAVQGTPNVYLNAAIAFSWVLTAHILAHNNKFPSHLANLRKSKEPSSKHLAARIEKTHLGYWSTIRKAPLFLVGYMYLLALALMNIPAFKTLEILGTTLPQLLLLKQP